VTVSVDVSKNQIDNAEDSSIAIDRIAIAGTVTERTKINREIERSERREIVSAARASTFLLAKKFLLTEFEQEREWNRFLKKKK